MGPAGRKIPRKGPQVASGRGPARLQPRDRRRASGFGGDGERHDERAGRQGPQKLQGSAEEASAAGDQA